MFNAPWHFIVPISIIYAASATAATAFTPQRLFPLSSTSSLSPNQLNTSYVVVDDVSSSVTKAKVSSVDASKAKSTASNAIFQGILSQNFQPNWRNNSEIGTTKHRNKNNFLDKNDSRREVYQQQQQQRIPFIIENIGRGEKSDIEEIVRLCIDVFFNEQEQSKVELQDTFFDASTTSNAMPTTRKRMKQKSTPPWKALQLAYLRNLQMGEILARNAFNKERFVNLIVARRVYDAPPSGMSDIIRGEKKNRRVIFMDDDVYHIFNADLLTSPSSIANGGDTSATGCVVTGEIIGYCEVSEKNFGLGDNYESTRRKRRNRSSTAAFASSTVENSKLRPYLSNLSVVDYARKSGVGSKLLDAGEAAVRNWNAGHTEIVLQVEEDNTNAIEFYKRRGWEFVFSDPTCRRYDTSGFFLRECRITKYAMIKRLDEITNTTTAAGDSDGSDSEKSLIERFMKSFFSQ